MWTFARRIGVVGLAVAAWLAFEAPAAQAQVRIIPSFQQRNPYNPSLVYVAPGLTQAQYLAQVRAYARTAAQIPPWLYGYNPYPSPIISTGPVIPTGPSGPGYPGITNPWGMGGVTNPYTPVSSPYSPAGVTNPYTPVDSYGGGSYPSYPPYSDYYDPAGSTLRGQADIMRSYGTLLTSVEQARQMREKAYQDRLDTIRRKFDLDMYIKANTPTYTEIQARKAALTLKRIQDNAAPGEINSGRSHNVLLSDLDKYRGKTVTQEVATLPEEILVSLNVAGPTSMGTLGIIRNGKLPSWPAALQESLPLGQRKAIEDQLLSLLKTAESGKVDLNQAKELKKTLAMARDQLGRRFDDVGPSEYLDGSRFLGELDLARISMQNGDAKAQAEYLTWARGGPRTIQALATFLIEKGYKIAPSTLADEAAYRAVHSALAALDVQTNVQYAAASPEYKE
jgi:hypothetical protein